MKFKNFSFNLYNPFVLFGLIWSFAIFLYSIELTNNIRGLNQNTTLLIYSSLIIILFLNFGFFLVRSNKSLGIKEIILLNPISVVRQFEKIINRIFKIWAFCSIVEVILFKGLPLISVVILKNSDLDYSKFGVPTLHGLLNSLYFTFMAGYFIIYYLTNNKKYLVRIVIYILWPILLMSRASLLWVFSELLCIYLLFNKVHFKTLLRLFSFILIFIYLFGIIGDARIGESSSFKTSSFVSPQYEEIAEKIPTGFVWVYLYATTPINNIVTQTTQLNPKYNFKYTTAGLIPSFIRDRIYKEDDKYGFELDNDAFNVSSFYSNYLNDFGIIGAIIIVGLLFLQVLAFYYKCYSGKLGFIVAYPAIFYAIFTSIFFDNFFSLVTIFQIFVGLIINRLLYKKTPYV